MVNNITDSKKLCTNIWCSFFSKPRQTLTGNDSVLWGCHSWQKIHKNFSIESIRQPLCICSIKLQHKPIMWYSNRQLLHLSWFVSVVVVLVWMLCSCIHFSTSYVHLRLRCIMSFNSSIRLNGKPFPSPWNHCAACIAHYKFVFFLLGLCIFYGHIM